MSEEEAETTNVLHRGPRETIYYEWRPLYFRLPFESYLISGDKLGADPNTCYLSVTGFIPDDKKAIILGQPFFSNYYTVLDQDTMKIGLAANLGSFAAIQDEPFQDYVFATILFIILLIALFGTIGWFLFDYIRKGKIKFGKTAVDEIEESLSKCDEFGGGDPNLEPGDRAK